MRCEHCLLEAADASALPVEEFLEQLEGCDACPATGGEGTLPIVQMLAGRLREAARHTRKITSKLRQREVELRDLREEIDKFESRTADLQQLHKASTRELEAQLELVQHQQASIRELSMPMIEVAEGVIVLPIIGALDAERTGTITESLLDAVQSRGVRRAILDLTGLARVDADTTELLLRVLAAVRLLGAEVLLSGVKPQVARSMIAEGADLTGITTVRSVMQALSAPSRSSR